MSADTRPISPSRFSAALKELSIPTLHLKVLEIRNSIAHLQYSNSQLQPFADGTAVPVSGGSPGAPDQDCVDAIRENESVIVRMQERISLVRTEVEERGMSWNEFRSKEEVEEDQQRATVNGTAEARDQGANGAAAAATTGRSETGAVPEQQQTSAPRAERTHPAWSDGTFQMGTIRNGEVHLDEQPTRSGGRLTDEQLQRAMEDRLRELGVDNDDDDDEGMHL